jgi:NitT/TauT family transport system ATP-binding protein
MLSIRHLTVRFTGHLGRLDALDDVTFDVQRGEFVCLIGPSGCGKSTLLRLVAGLIPPGSGEILLDGHTQRGPHRKVGLVFQQPTLLPWRTVAANVSLPLEIAGVPAGTPVDKIRQRSAALLDLVGLRDFAKEYPSNLSGGMAQRVAIARALCQDPAVLLLDEPFGALDALTREHMAEELLRIWGKSQRTVLMVTHNVAEAALLSDRVVVLSPRPGHVTDIVTVDLPRPRTPEMLTSQALQRVARTLRAALSRNSARA